ncbi:MAG: hypothetical protein V3V26_00275 [Candidatus Aenigmarchaeota archaeon]
MPIIGMNFRSMEAKRIKEGSTGEIKVNSTPKITGMKEINISSLNKKALSMSFEFSTKYDPQIAEIKIGGEIVYLAEKNGPILNQWKKKKSLPENVSVEILNHLFRKCLLKIAYMADDLQLPPPVQIPRVKPKEA